MSEAVSSHQRKWTLAEKYVLSSDFDSGNLADAKFTSETSRSISFELRILPDCENFGIKTVYNTWFYFSITGFEQGKVLKFTISNLNRQNALFKHDMRPVVRSIPTNPKWERVLEPCRTEPYGEKQCKMSFSHHTVKGSSLCFFAFTYPFSVTEITSMVDRFYDAHRIPPDREVWHDDDVYFEREVMTYSTQDRPMELITVSNCNGRSEERESVFGNPADGIELFPHRETKPRPFRFPEKQTVLISARIHPGETPGSFALEGFLEFLLQLKDPRAQALRSMFVFKIVPLLNPDGVALGFYRADTSGVNLNRYYHAPVPTEHPTVYAMLHLALHHHSRKVAEGKGGLFFYLDFHAHASKRGCFLYGNHMKTVEEQQENLLYAYLLQLNTPHFDLDASNFTEKNMKSTDKAGGPTKEGSSRVALYNRTLLPHIYTLECNYNTGRFMGKIPAETGTKDRGHDDISYAPFAVVGRLTVSRFVPKYTPAIWQAVGKACCVSISDLVAVNPHSRIPNSDHRSLTGVRAAVFDHLRRTPYAAVCGCSDFVPSPYSIQIRHAERAVRRQPIHRRSSKPKLVSARPPNPATADPPKGQTKKTTPCPPRSTSRGSSFASRKSAARRCLKPAVVEPVCRAETEKRVVPAGTGLKAVRAMRRGKPKEEPERKGARSR